MRERMLPANNGRAAGGTETQEVQKFPLRHSGMNIRLLLRFHTKYGVFPNPASFPPGKITPQTADLLTCIAAAGALLPPAAHGPARTAARPLPQRGRTGWRAGVGCAAHSLFVLGRDVRFVFEVGTWRFSLGRRCGCEVGFAWNMVVFSGGGFGIRRF